jgi:hypothetical protein
MLPRGIENLLVVGRCASSDHVANGAVRSEAVCMLTGQAAGTAAAMASKSKTAPRALPIGELQKVLVSQGVLI